MKLTYTGNSNHLHNKYTLPFHLLNQVNSIIVDILKVQFPFDDTMCKDKYNETISDYLHEEIITKLTN